MESKHLLWRQLQVSFRLLIITLPTYLFNVGLFTLTFGPLLPGGVAWVWLGACVVVGLGWFVAAHLFRSPDTPQAGRRVSLGLAAFALSQALLFDWFYFTVYPLTDDLGRLALSGFSVALIILGSVALATLPASAAAWMGGLFLGIAATQAADPRWTSSPLWACIASLAVALPLMVVTYHRMFQARLRAEVQAVRQSQLVSLLLHDFEEGTQDWLWETDGEGRLRGVSSRLADQLGRSVPEVEGRFFVEALVDDNTHLTVEEEEDLAALSEALRDGRPFRDLEVPAQTKGRHRRWRLTAKPILEEDETVIGWRGVGTDVSEVERLHNLNARLALLDGLTGLANRHRLMAVLHDHLSPRHGDRPCGLILLDLHGFRAINESQGHEVGDGLLREVATRLRSRVPSSSLLARLGGDEFALVAPGAGDNALQGLVSALRAAGEDPFEIEGKRIEINFQIGSAWFPRDADTAADLLVCAEMALHESKMNHGELSPTADLSVAYRPDLGLKAKKRNRLEVELRSTLSGVPTVENGVKTGAFELHYQPQLRASDGALVGAEALVRWRHPRGDLVPPGDFIPVLEETGLIVPVGLLILEMACLEALTWPVDQKVAVNVSAVQFASRTPAFLDSVSGVLSLTKLPAHRLELEITESVMAQDPKQVIRILESLRTLGVSISLDDFGTGYSSLAYLRQLPLDKVKVDQSFVRTMDRDPTAAAIVRTVLDLSKTLGLETTAEGVETEEQKALLVGMGVDNIQGYLYSKPLPSEAFQAFRKARGGGS